MNRLIQHIKSFITSKKVQLKKYITSHRFLRNSIKRHERTSKKLTLLLVKFFWIKKDYKYWDKQKVNEIENYQVNSDSWRITITKIKKLGKKVNYWTVKDAYWHSYVKLNYIPKTKAYREYRTHIGALNEHLTCSKTFYEQEKKRQDNIDSKAKQIITNSGIVLTLFGALIAFVFNSQTVENISKVNIIGVVIIISFLIIALSIAVYILDFKKYSRPGGELILEQKYYNREDYLRERVISYIFPLELNIATNTQKSKGIRTANLLFWIALCFVSGLICYNILNIEHKPKEDIVHKVEIVNDIKVKTDTVEVIIIGKDTLMIKNIDLEEIKSSLQHAVIKHCADSAVFERHNN